MATGAEFTLETVEQLSALAHPLRQRILSALLELPRTNKQLATLLQESPARLHFHVRELARAGLIELVEARPKGGVIEKYYRAVASSFRLDPALGAVAPGLDGVVGAAFGAARTELARAIEQFAAATVQVYMANERAPLSDEALARVHKHLEAIAEEFQAASDQPPEQAPRHAIAFTALLHRAVAEP
ncbi:MAG: ArsR/SmtB family transcription factor [Chloroflexota bacterium]